MQLCHIVEGLGQAVIYFLLHCSSICAPCTSLTIGGVTNSSHVSYQVKLTKISVNPQTTLSQKSYCTLHYCNTNNQYNCKIEHLGKVSFHNYIIHFPC